MTLGKRLDDVLQSERAQVVHRELKAEARVVLAPVQEVVERMRVGPCGTDALLEAEVELARRTWDLTRDAMLAALEVEREEARLRADVTATALLVQSDD
jgi:hypothetical protein